MSVPIKLGVSLSGFKCASACYIHFTHCIGGPNADGMPASAVCSSCRLPDLASLIGFSMPHYMNSVDSSSIQSSHFVVWAVGAANSAGVCTVGAEGCSPMHTATAEKQVMLCQTCWSSCSCISSACRGSHSRRPGSSRAGNSVGR